MSNRDSIFEQWMSHGINCRTRTFLMTSFPSEDESEGGTDYKMAAACIKAMHLLDASCHAPITILMNNPGGDEYHGLAIYDAIRECESHVTIKVYGHAMSMGSIILQAADLRVMMPNSRLMIHYGQLSLEDHTKNFHKWSDEMKKFDIWMEALYLEKIREKLPNFSKKKLEGMCNFDTYLTASEAVEIGLADRIG